MTQAKPQLDEHAIRDGVMARLKKYDGRNQFELFAIYLGTAQLLEFGLKKLLEAQYQCKPEEMDHWTLGKTRKELEQRGCRPDFIRILKPVVEARNYVAHELLANDALIRSLLGGDCGGLEFGRLNSWIYELEQACFLFDWATKNDGWSK